ncbi:hypothetical protein PMW_178 [Pseudomonas phage phiPMW]|uniref:Uncharacterized protein n=1 Tax=Pseudomonas phage phiPMW TaxID=1815582 RepID=A0A1S5R1L9_9CAUD|nr:hypothetical protein FDG97_gp172 [Pseudomonas phage phiPMW]ANA49303.1 hypothetical protein PMW_178 [Pseudomonas phage phiPMW]
MSKALELLNTKQCPECGEFKLYWFTHLHGGPGIQDGRHKLNEIQVDMILGCDYCSETVGRVSSEQFLEVFNGN